MAREKRTDQINFRIEPERKKRLEALARATQRTQADVIRTLIDGAAALMSKPIEIQAEERPDNEGTDTDI